MSRVPVGKVLLRNVIRHTGAHNKIQEETEMWKIREWEKQTEETYWKRQSRMLSDTSRAFCDDDVFTIHEDYTGCRQIYFLLNESLERDQTCA